MTQIVLNVREGNAAVIEKRGTCMPIQYNNAKPKNPVIMRCIADKEVCMAAQSNLRRCAYFYALLWVCFFCAMCSAIIASSSPGAGMSITPTAL